MKLQYLDGDATKPQIQPQHDLTYILNGCNSMGKWGKGFVLPLGNKWPLCKQEYFNWYNSDAMNLGDVRFVRVEPDIIVCNMITERVIYADRHKDLPPIWYPAIRVGLRTVKEAMVTDVLNGRSPAIHMPRLGAGLAGGDWDKIVAIIENCFMDSDFDIYVYNYKGRH